MKIHKMKPKRRLPERPDADLMCKRVAVYARVSTKSDEQQTSLAAQKDYYTKQIGLRTDWILAGVYADEGISGTGLEHREAFNRMLADCERGRIDLILTKSLSRFARNTVDTLKVIRKLRDLHIVVHFEKEHLDTGKEHGEFLITLLSSVAQEESRNLSENVRWGKRKRFADGHYSLGFSHFLGYDRGFVINEAEADVVRSIYLDALYGFGYQKIARRLSNAGIATPFGKEKWRLESVKSILQNVLYKGDALLQKTYVEDFITHKQVTNHGELPQYYVKQGHDPIIEPEVFDYVQEQLARRCSFNAIPGKRYSGIGFWTSRIVCGSCGATYGRRSWHSTTTNDRVWQCRHSTDGTKPRCTNPHVYDKHLQILLAKCARKLLDKRAKAVNLCHAVLEDSLGRDTTKLKAGRFNYADEADLAIIVQQITISRDEFILELIDGGTIRQPLIKSTYGTKKHHDLVKTRIPPIICKHCGKTFYAYGHGHKYCSHQCYIADRFGHS